MHMGIRKAGHDKHLIEIDHFHIGCGHISDCLIAAGGDNLIAVNQKCGIFAFVYSAVDICFHKFSP